MDTDSTFQDYYANLKALLMKGKDDGELFETIVNAPFSNKLHATSIDLGMIVLVLANKKTKMVERIAYSKTQPALDAARGLPIEFRNIKIPLKNNDNIAVKAVRTGKSYKTSDWRSILSPALSPEAARFNQAEAGIGCSFVYPLLGARDGGALIFSFYQSIDMIGHEHHNFMEKYCELVTQKLNRAIS